MIVILTVIAALLIAVMFWGGAQSRAGERPRWLADVIVAQPDVSWDYKNQLSHDLDCDGAEEGILSGFHKPTEKYPNGLIFLVIGKDRPDGTAEIFTTVFTIDPAKSGDTDYLTSKDINLEIIRSGDKNMKRCMSSLQINHGTGEPVMLTAHGIPEKPGYGRRVHSSWLRMLTEKSLAEEEDN